MALLIVPPRCVHSYKQNAQDLQELLLFVFTVLYHRRSKAKTDAASALRRPESDTKRHEQRELLQQKRDPLSCSGTRTGLRPTPL